MIDSGSCKDNHDHEHLESFGISWKVWLAAFGAVILVSASGLIGVALVPLKSRSFYNIVTQFLIALSIGSLTGDAFLHLIPHALFPHTHSHEESESHSHHEHEKAQNDHDDLLIYRLLGASGDTHKQTVVKGLIILLGIHAFFITERATILWQNFSARRKLKKRWVCKAAENDSVGKPPVSSEAGAADGPIVGNAASIKNGFSKQPLMNNSDRSTKQLQPHHSHNPALCPHSHICAHQQKDSGGMRSHVGGVDTAPPLHKTCRGGGMLGRPVCGHMVLRCHSHVPMPAPTTSQGALNHPSSNSPPVVSRWMSIWHKITGRQSPKKESHVNSQGSCHPHSSLLNADDDNDAQSKHIDSPPSTMLDSLHSKSHQTGMLCLEQEADCVQGNACPDDWETDELTHWSVACSRDTLSGSPCASIAAAEYPTPENGLIPTSAADSCQQLSPLVCYEENAPNNTHHLHEHQVVENTGNTPCSIQSQCTPGHMNKLAVSNCATDFTSGVAEHANSTEERVAGICQHPCGEQDVHASEAAAGVVTSQAQAVQRQQQQFLVSPLRDRPHGHHHGHSHDLSSVRSIAYTIIVGDGLHNFCDGIAIGAAFASDLSSGVSTFIAVMCHELPHELGDFAVLLSAGMTVKTVLFYNLLTSVFCCAGMILGVLLGSIQWLNTWLFMLTAGMFIYIALVDMMPELATQRLKGNPAFHRPTMLFLSQNAGILCGVLIMVVIALME